MSLLAPVWLLGLLPWGVLAYWLMQRRRRPTGVPFVRFWRGPYHPPKPTRQFARPPLAVALALASLLAALFAAARPTIDDPLRRGRKPIPVVIDRGRGPSVRGGKRLAEALRQLQHELGRAGVSPRRQLELHAVPAAPVVRKDVSDLTDPLPFLLTAADTSAAVSATASRLLDETAGVVIVVSDQPPGLSSERVIRVPLPPDDFRDVGIAHLAATVAPRPQVMATIVARQWSTPVRLIVSSGGVDTLSTVAPPMDVAERNVFVDVPTLGQTIWARLDVSDDDPADDHAWLVREGVSPKIEPDVTLPPSLQRVVDSYVAIRHAGENEARVSIVGDVARAGVSPSVVLPSTRGGRVTASDLTVSPHAVTRDVDFSAIGEGAVAADAPPVGWTPLVRRGGDVWVAVRERPARQVWVGFDAPAWVGSPAFVVFWAGIFDWVGGGDWVATYEATTVGALGPEWTPLAAPPALADPRWWPGLFRGSEGNVRAVNAPVLLPAPVTETGWRQQLELLRRVDRFELCPYLLLAATACLGGGVIAWKPSSLTEKSGKTTVAADGVLTEARAARAEATRSPLTQRNPSG